MSKSISAALAGGSPAVIDATPRSDAAVMQHFLRQPGFLLARIDQICTAIHGEISGGETLAQAEFLLLLAAIEQPDQISLARAAGADTSTTALVLDNLEDRGLITRESDRTDRRRFKLHLTAAGRRQLPRTRQSFLQTQERLIEPLEKSEAEELVLTLRKIGANPMSPAPLWVPADGQKGADGIVSGSPTFLCRRALQVSEAYFLTCTAPLNLTPRQFSLLFILSQRPGLSQAGFARLFGLDPSTCAVIMRNLHGRGLLDRQVSKQDRRERIYSLTDAGRRMLREAQPLADKSSRLVFRSMSKTQLRRLVRQLQQIVRAHSGRLRFPGVLFSDD